MDGAKLPTMKHVVITGVSSGIGRAAALELAAHGYHVFGSVRKAADATDLQAQLGDKFSPLVFDVTDESAVQAAAERVSESLGQEGLNGLVNNAGIALGGPLMHQPLNELRHQFEVNVFGLMAVTQAFLPLLGARLPQSRPPGRIINISSVAGKVTYPFVGAYGASKHALEALSDALRRELLIYGIDVIVIEPGNIVTEIWDKAEQADLAPYAKTDYIDIMTEFKKGFIALGKAGLEVAVVSRTIRASLESKRPKARYAIPDQPIRGWLLQRLLPARWFDRMLAKLIGLGRKT